MSDEQPRPKPGEHWRWTIEGKVVGAEDVIGAVFLEGSWVDVKHGTWTRLPDLEPEYIIGAMYQDAAGRYWLRACGWFDTMGIARLEDAPLRPLVRLIPEINVPERAPDA